MRMSSHRSRPRSNREAEPANDTRAGHRQERIWQHVLRPQTHARRPTSDLAQIRAATSYFLFLVFAARVARFLFAGDDGCVFLIGTLAIGAFVGAFFADFRFNALRTVPFVADANFLMGFDSAISLAFAPAIPPTTAPTAAPRGPANEPAAAPAAAPPTIPRPELALDCLPVVFTFAIASPSGEILCFHRPRQFTFLFTKRCGRHQSNDRRRLSAVRWLPKDQIRPFPAGGVAVRARPRLFI